MLIGTGAGRWCRVVGGLRLVLLLLLVVAVVLLLVVVVAVVCGGGGTPSAGLRLPACRRLAHRAPALRRFVTPHRTTQYRTAPPHPVPHCTAGMLNGVYVVSSDACLFVETFVVAYAWRKLQNTPVGEAVRRGEG